MALNHLRAEFRELANAGNTAPQIAASLGISYATARNWADRDGIVLAVVKRGPKKDAKPIRTAQMVAMHKQGCTLNSIGVQFGVTRERVRQILVDQGIGSGDGGASVGAALRVERKQARRESSALRAYGLPYDVVLELRSAGLIAAFRSQRAQAKIRDIDWRLGFAEWHAVWHASGKLHLRGRGKGKYVMSRIKDDGPYALGNIHIQLATENSKEAADKWRGQTKTNRGVYCLYPGRKLAWLAKAGDERLGFFETEAAAVEARDAYFIKNPDARRQDKGYALTGTPENRRYQVMVRKKYVGTYKTPEAAIAARRDYLAETSVA